MGRRVIDISVPLQNDVAADPPGHGPKTEYIGYQQSVPQILPFSRLEERGSARRARMGG
jgi:hypothetical protein